MENKNETYKPVSVILSEIKNNLRDVVSNAGLHISVLDMIVGEFYNEVHNIAVQQEERELQKYNLSLKKTENNSKDLKQETETVE